MINYKSIHPCADLRGANLQGADLRRANLRGADLRGANLLRANLLRANLRGANLQGAYLQNANLHGAYLQNANLQGAYLRGAHLQNADLQGADLRRVDLRGANLDLSCWPLNCESLGVIAGDRLAAQLFFHWARLNVSQCSPHIRYMHKFIINLFGKSMANWFCKYRTDVDKI